MTLPSNYEDLSDITYCCYNCGKPIEDTENEIVVEIEIRVGDGSAVRRYHFCSQSCRDEHGPVGPNA